MEVVIRDFGGRKGLDDPVVHFYELFLKEYDRARRLRHGVFFTPQPLVRFLVQGVHALLQQEFALEDGLAATASWGEMQRRHPGLRRPADVPPEEPFVQVLDPDFFGGRYVFTALHRDEADFEKNKASGWQQGTEIALDQFVAHVQSMK